MIEKFQLFLKNITSDYWLLKFFSNKINKNGYSYIFQQWTTPLTISWSDFILLTYLFLFITTASLFKFTNFLAWLILAFFLELHVYLYANPNLRIVSFLCFFYTLILGFLFVLHPDIGWPHVATYSDPYNFFSHLLNQIKENVLHNSFLFQHYINLSSTGPNNFLFNFFSIYPTQSCGAYDDFFIQQTNNSSLASFLLHNHAFEVHCSLVDWNSLHFMLEGDSNPLFFTYYNLGFFKHELFFFFLSIIVLFLGLFFYNAFSLYSYHISAQFDFLYRFTELSLLAILLNMHASSAFDFAASVSTFGYSFVFNNLLAVHPALFILKDFLIFLFLFFVFFFRIRAHLLSKFNAHSSPLLVIEHKPRDLPKEIPFLLIMVLFFTSLLFSANDFNILLICLEALTFIIATIIAFDPSKAAASASIKYFTLGVASAGLLSMASALTYGLLLVLDFKSITDFFYFTQLMTLEFVSVFVFASILFFFSFFIKLSVFPGNFWVLDIYNGCNMPTISVLVLLKSVYFILLSKLYFSVYSIFYVFLFPLILAASIGSMLFSAYGLLSELHLKQFIAYSSTGQFGFLLITFICYQDYVTFSYIVLYLFYYVTVMLIFFFSIAHFSGLSAVDKLTDLLKYRSVSVASFFLVISLLSLAGLPPFFGFFAKISILLNASSSGLSPACLFTVFVLNIAMSFGYIRALRLIYFSIEEPMKITKSLHIDEQTASLIYFSDIATQYLWTDFFIRNSYLLYSSMIIILSFIHIFGFYFFGYVLYYITPISSFLVL